MKMVFKVLSVFTLLFCVQNIFCMGRPARTPSADEHKVKSSCDLKEIGDYFRGSGKVDQSLMQTAIEAGNMTAVRYFFGSRKAKMPSNALCQYLFYLCNSGDYARDEYGQVLKNIGYLLANGASAGMCLVENGIATQQKWRKAAEPSDVKLFWPIISKLELAKKIEESKIRVTATREEDSDYDFSDPEEEVRKFIKRRKKERFF